MGNYRNFKLAVYFVAHGTATETRERLREELAFFRKYMRLDKVYLEHFRDGAQASPGNVALCREEFERSGIEVAGGLTTCIPTPEGDAPKARLFNTFCYNDEKMLAALSEASAFLGGQFGEFIIDDFFFTNCTCDKCRAERDKYNAARGVAGWAAYRLDLMRRVSAEYILAPAKRANPDCRVIIKYPNWAESYQETGYNPAEQRIMFDGVYTGTETRDTVRTDQNLPRYLSYSLMTYFEAMSPRLNGGGWFDPFDMYCLDHYLEQAYLTAFSKPKELMMFCFQALVDTPEAAALGYHLDRLDAALDHLGTPVGVPCYLPDDSRGEDNAHDFLGMAGFPITLTPYFPQSAPVILLTAAAARDAEIVRKLDKYVAGGGKAVVTGGFIRSTLGRGIENITSIRYDGRRAEFNDYMCERITRASQRMEYAHAREKIGVPVMEFANNATWAVVKGYDGGESYALLTRDTYGKGELWTLNLPDSYGRIRHIPAAALSRMRAELPVNGIYLEGGEGISLFHYDNGAFIVYAYAQEGADASDAYIHIKGKPKALNAPALSKFARPRRVEPYITTKDETIFRITATPGKYNVFIPEY